MRKFGTLAVCLQLREACRVFSVQTLHHFVNAVAELRRIGHILEAVDDFARGNNDRSIVQQSSQETLLDMHTFHFGEDDFECFHIQDSFLEDDAFVGDCITETKINIGDLDDTDEHQYHSSDYCPEIPIKGKNTQENDEDRTSIAHPVDFSFKNDSLVSNEVLFYITH